MAILKLENSEFLFSFPILMACETPILVFCKKTEHAKAIEAHCLQLTPITTCSLYWKAVLNKLFEEIFLQMFLWRRICQMIIILAELNS
jgi:hypothetical protein